MEPIRSANTLHFRPSDGIEHVLCKHRIKNIHSRLHINAEDAQVLVVFLGLDSGICKPVTREEIQNVLNKLARSFRLSVAETILRIKEVVH